MIQFTEAEVRRLQERGKRRPSAVERMRQAVSEVMEAPVLVPETGLGNWELYYYCPDCSVMLEFNREDRHHHRCPVCGRSWSGEPYDSTWWGLVNSRNYTAAFQMGLLYLITDEVAYAQKAIAVMMEYSKYYKDYEVHGDIPYNGPGKAGAQTLDDANFLRTFGMAYDLLEAAMTVTEREAIRDGMLLPGAEFLIEHRHKQLHNHEVIINSAIAIIGLLTGVEQYVRLAVYEPYGLLYQLEHGMQQNHMWFEGAFGYHFYALTSFFAYEKFALHTPHSHISHPNYRAMMEILFSYLEPGFQIPMLNDTNYGHTNSSLYLYEFAYRELGGDKLLFILNQLYRQEERNNPEAFVYGVDELTECSLEFADYHVPEGMAGNTILRGSNDRYLLFKHDRYGGEHDHYDRLAISYLAYGKRISADLGTTGYGARMHYDYYKNTGSHNTVNIGEENQSPVNAVLERYEEKDGVIYVTAVADWTVPYEPLDSFTIVQWQEENYWSVRMERKIVWTDDYFVEAFKVKGACPELPVDWMMHFSGNPVLQPEGDEAAERFIKKPYRYFHSLKHVRAVQKSEPVVTAYADGEVMTHVFSASSGQDLFYGKGPDNPPASDINYQVERCFGSTAVFAHVISSSDDACKVKSVFFEMDDGSVTVAVETAEGLKQSFIL